MRDRRAVWDGALQLPPPQLLTPFSPETWARGQQAVSLRYSTVISTCSL